MTEVDRQTDEGWAEDRAAFTADTGGENWDRCEVNTSGPLASHFGALAKTLLETNSVHDAMTQVVEAARRIVPSADLVSITLRSADGRFHTPVATAEFAEELDQIQYRTGEGPCVEAARHDSPGHALTNSLAQSTAFARFGPQAAEFGFGSLLAVTLLPDRRSDRLPGAINLYSRRTGAFTDDAVDHALILSAHASIALASTAAHTAAGLRESQLRQAIDSRDVIGQAKGILMNRRGISADDAFEILRRTSQELNVKLTRLAHTLAERHQELDD
ncbi:GAF and ANTAR domain-containing protein [Amycolatopsis sp. NPDC089917]|uniref:GAF and ANTAR domain-containing protein n=1 Tax=Amycolatopsis sp. NPDC089917 TaxID=3155187 RepID=UPI003418B7BC